MKKIVIVAISMVMVLVLGGCVDKTSISSEKFIKEMEGNSLEITQLEEEQIVTPIKELVIAKNTKAEYQIEYYKTETLEDAQSLISYLDGEIEATFEVLDREEKDSNNWIKITNETETYILILAQVDNTMIFANGLVENKETLEKIIEELEY